MEETERRPWQGQWQARKSASQLWSWPAWSESSDSSDYASVRSLVASETSRWIVDRLWFCVSHMQLILLAWFALVGNSLRFVSERVKAFHASHVAYAQYTYIYHTYLCYLTNANEFQLQINAALLSFIWFLCIERVCDIGGNWGAKVDWTVVAASLQRRVLAWGSLFRVILV